MFPSFFHLASTGNVSKLRTGFGFSQKWRRANRPKSQKLRIGVACAGWKKESEPGKPWASLIDALSGATSAQTSLCYFTRCTVPSLALKLPQSERRIQVWPLHHIQWQCKRVSSPAPFFSHIEGSFQFFKVCVNAHRDFCATNLWWNQLPKQWSAKQNFFGRTGESRGKKFSPAFSFMSLIKGCRQRLTLIAISSANHATVSW